MRILILTQNENFYLPNSFGRICQSFGSEIVCIVSAPAMSTHGGLLRGFWRHFRFFGAKGTAIMGLRVVVAKIKALLQKPNAKGPFYSIKAVANCFHIPFHYVKKINSNQFHAILNKYEPQLLISISCPQIIGEKIRDRFHLGCINVHGAPLPKYRGLMPAFWAMRNNENKTAATVHEIAAKLDNGDILLQHEVQINSEDSWDSLVRKTKAAGAEALIKAVQQIKSGKIERHPNPDSEATYFSFPTAKERKAFLRAGRRFF